MNIAERCVASPVTEMADTDSELDKRVVDDGIGGFIEGVR